MLLLSWKDQNYQIMFDEGCIKYQGENQSKVKFKFCALCLKDFYLIRTEKWGKKSLIEYILLTWGSVSSMVNILTFLKYVPHADPHILLLNRWIKHILKADLSVSFQYLIIWCGFEMSSTSLPFFSTTQRPLNMPICMQHCTESY